jgi:hypothetical protein
MLGYHRERLFASYLERDLAPRRLSEWRPIFAAMPGERVKLSPTNTATADDVGMVLRPASSTMLGTPFHLRDSGPPFAK